MPRVIRRHVYLNYIDDKIIMDKVGLQVIHLLLDPPGIPYLFC